MVTRLNVSEAVSVREGQIGEGHNLMSKTKSVVLNPLMIMISLQSQSTITNHVNSTQTDDHNVKRICSIVLVPLILPTQL